MDAFDTLLDGPRARGAFLLRAVLEPPWSMRIQDEAPVGVVAMLAGDACVVHDDGRVAVVRAGDVAVIRGDEPYALADDPATPPQLVVHPGQRCTTPNGESPPGTMDMGVRTWGNSAAGSTTMLVGVYQMRGEISRRLLDALPDVVTLCDHGWQSPLVALLADEIVKDEPGQDVVLDRLLDLLLVDALRTWFARVEAEAPSWLRARGDAVVGPALRLLQNNPAHPWTVAALAGATGVSRSALARRFTELVGEPPMTFLAGWRLALAADLLRDTDATLGAVARQVGYGSPFALSTAFKRVRGVSPAATRPGRAVPR